MRRVATKYLREMLGILFLCPLILQASEQLSRTISIAVSKTSYPYHFQNEQGQAEGVMIDLWKLWAKKQNVNIEFVLSDWKSTLSNVKSGAADIHAGLMSTEEREEYFDFSSVFFNQNSYVFIHRDFQISDLGQLLPFTLGVVENSSHTERIKALYPQLKMRAYKGRFALYDAALNGEILAFANLDTISYNYSRYKEIQTNFPPYKQIPFSKEQYVAAVKENNIKLLNFVEEGLKKISPEEKSTIEKKWLGVDKKNGVLVLAFTPELPPYMSISPSGKPQGLFIDIWRLWADQMGLSVEFIPQAMSDIVEVINQGGADIHIAYPEHKEVMDALTVAEKVYSVSSYVFVSQKLPNIRTLAELKGKKVGIFETAPYKDSLIAKYPDIKFIIFENFSQVFESVELEEIDAMIGAAENMQANLIRANLHSLFYRLNESSFTADIFSLTEKNNTRLALMIKEGFQLIPVEKLIQLEKRWLSDDSYGYFKIRAEKISLTINEKHFLQNNKVIKMGVNRHWNPVEFVDEKGDVQGINSDINTIIEQRTGINFTYVQYNNWNEMFLALQKNEIDLVASAVETQERKKILAFSEPYWQMPWAIIHKRSDGEQLKISDFNGKEVAIVKGYHLINIIRKEHPTINLRLVDDHEEGLKAIQKGIVKGFVENIASASELIKRESLITLSMSVVDEFNVDKDSYAIRKDWPLLKSIIDKAVITITDEERRKIYEKWFDINIETGFDKNTVLRLSVQLGIIILIVIVVIVVWNRRLYIEVKTRKSLEEKMKHMATHDELTGLANRVLLKDRIRTAISLHQRQSLQMAVLFIDLDGFKTINDTYGHDVGDELLVEVANRLSNCVRQSDTIVRFGGDEFVLLLTGLHNKNEAAFIGDKVLKYVQQPFKLSVIKANIGCSIGIAMYPDDGLTDTDLLKEADTLMYKVKAAGKNHYVFNS